MKYSHMLRSVVPVLFFLIVAFGSSPLVRAETLKVFVSIPPQACFVERIGGSHVEVSVLVGPGMSPHTYEPTPRQMAALGDADVFFRIGSSFENRLVEKLEVALRGLKIVDTRDRVPLRFFDSHNHDHGHDQERRKGHDGGGGHRCGEAHSGRSADPHIWLDPKRIIIQARTIFESLSELDPARADYYRRNLTHFEKELRDLDGTLAEMLAPLEGQTFYVFHPAFGYFADSYGLRQEAIEIDGKEPAPRQLATIIEKARRDGVRVIFVQPQFSTRQAEAMAREIGGVVIPMDPLARDCLANLYDMARAIQSALGESEGRP